MGANEKKDATFHPNHELMNKAIHATGDYRNHAHPIEKFIAPPETILGHIRRIHETDDGPSIRDKIAQVIQDEIYGGLGFTSSDDLDLVSGEGFFEPRKIADRILECLSTGEWDRPDWRTAQDE